MKYFVIGDEDTVLGFGMVGVEGKAVDGEEETRAALDTALGDPDVGIILITERSAAAQRSLVDKYMFSRRFPLIVEIPDYRGPMEGRPSLRELVNQAIGIKL